MQNLRASVLGVSAGVALALVATAANADGYRRGSVKDAACCLSWQGFYVGAHAGWGWKDETFEVPWFRGAFPPPAFSSLEDNGGVFGAQFGYNWQTHSRMVVGIEADISWTTIEGTSTLSTVFGGATVTDVVNTEVEQLGSLRGKVGFAVTDSLLVYATGGLGFGQTSLKLDFTTNPGTTQHFSNYETQFGWVAGVGGDWKVGRNVSVGVLYLHYDLGDLTRNITAFPPPGVFVDLGLPSSSVTVDTVTARLNLHFN
jgi:outer membrane immunogenic protein